MILVDANLLVYAHVRSSEQHEPAREWLDAQLNGTAAVGLPWPSLLAFVRLVANPRIFERPESVERAWAQVEAWLDCDPVWVPQPTERHRELLGPLLRVRCVSEAVVPFEMPDQVSSRRVCVAPAPHPAPPCGLAAPFTRRERAGPPV